MNSHFFCDLIDDYFDDDLSIERKAQFESHLASCPDCLRDLQSVREIDSLLRKAWLSLDLGIEPPVQVTAARGAAPIDSAHFSQSSFVSMIAALAAIVLLTIGISWVIDFAGEFGPVELTPGESVAVDVSDAVKRATTVGGGIDSSGYRISYASATFDSSTTGHKIATYKDFTVYQVVPQVTYSKTN